MADRLEGSKQLNEIIFQSPIDSFPHRDNYEKITETVAAHAVSIEALENGGTPPVSSSAEVIAARDQATDLQSRIRDSQSSKPYGVFSGVLDDSRVSPESPESAKVTVLAGQGVVNGTLYRVETTQTLTPANFTLGVTNPRIDVVYISADGVAGITTGNPAATPLPEQVPYNSLPLAMIYLYPSTGNPNVPKNIYSFEDDAGDSFIVEVLDKYIYNRRATHQGSGTMNLLMNGSFEILDDAGDPWSWVDNNVTLAQDADALFGAKSLSVTNDGTFSVHYVKQTISVLPELKGSYVTVTAYVKLKSAPAASPISTTIQLIETGSSPVIEDSTTISPNDKIWQRVILQAWVDNQTTALELRIFPSDMEAATSSDAILIDGVQMTRGLDVFGFQYPVPVVCDSSGKAWVGDFEIMGDQVVDGDSHVKGDQLIDGDADITGDVHITGTLFSSGAADVVAWFGL